MWQVSQVGFIVVASSPSVETESSFSNYRRNESGKKYIPLEDLHLLAVCILDNLDSTDEKFLCWLMDYFLFVIIL